MSAALSPSPDRLAALADDPWFILGAYFFAFFPWSVLNGLDYISEKWRTVRRTRNLARTHVVLTVFPMMYVATYAESQRRDGDYKEMAAAWRLFS